MLKAFKNLTVFSIIFFTFLVSDVYVKLTFIDSHWRILSKSFVIGLLILYLIVNKNKQVPKKFRLTLIALILFWIGDGLIIYDKIVEMYVAAILLFVVAKIFYVYRFSNQEDFEILQLMPFYVGCSAYMLLLLFLVYQNLGDFLIPVLLYVFVSLLLFLFSFLRKGTVNYTSFILVMIGVVVGVASDTITLLQGFYNPDIPYHGMMIMFFYGLSQYLIVVGLVEEKRINKRDSDFTELS